MISILASSQPATSLQINEYWFSYFYLKHNDQSGMFLLELNFDISRID